MAVNALVDGMVAGAIGYGVAYPLDTISAKIQAAKRQTPPTGTVQMAFTDARADDFLGTVQMVWEDAGFAGFYPGVGSTMAGQALIKGSVFSTYSCMKHAFSSMPGGEHGLALDSDAQMLISAALAGAVASFVATPVERVKLVMQRSPHGDYASALVCARSVVAADGVDGLFFRGLGAMLAREVPSYTFYFLAFELATAALVPIVALLPAFAWLVPLLGGAVAGVAAWVPVYPIDTVKAELQASHEANGDGHRVGALECTRRMYREQGGIKRFWQGLSPKLARAVVSSATTFYVYCALSSLA